MGFIDTIIAKASTDRKRIVLPETTDRRVLEAAAEIMARGIADIVLVGNPTAIATAGAGLDLAEARIVDPLTSPSYRDFSDTYLAMRKDKGMTPEKADETLLDPVFFGVMMVKKGQADGMVSGAVHSTADTLRPALQILKTAPGTKLVSSFFVMVVPESDFGVKGTLLFSDCGLVENPDAEQLSEIALSSAKSFQQLTGVEPSVAMLSYSTYGSAKNPLVDKVVEATRLAKAKAPSLRLDGELQADAALVPSVGKSKAPGSSVAGTANVLVFPDLNAGNIAYKLVQRLAKAEAYGPVTQGIARPVNDLSRGCSADDIVGVVAITAVQAQDME
jgi:phosphate acetyltransferase